MNNIAISFILTLIAGLSTLIGTIFIFIKCDQDKLTKYALSFASGVMICVSLIDLLPESISLLINENSKNNTFINLFLYIVVGFLIPTTINICLKEEKNTYNPKLYKIGILSMIAIIIHNIPEGIATFLSSSTNLSLGISITIAIALHNIPEGISISVPIYNATKNKKKAILLTLISGMSEPLGAIIAYLIIGPVTNNIIMGNILAVVVGIMVNISVIQLLPESLKYQNKKKTIVFFLIGIIFMYISLALMR